MKNPTISNVRRNDRPGSSRAVELLIKFLITASGWTAIIVLAAIAVFLFLSGMRAMQEVGVLNMLFGESWFPTSKNQQFGFLPAITGSLWATLVALSISVPLGIMSAVFISEFTGKRVKEIAKSIIEFMAAIPSVVLGLIGLAILAPWVRETFGTATGLTAMTAGMMVGFMCLPTIISISEDALHAVPNELRQGSAALGNTRWQTTYKVVIPAASSGIFAAVMLGLGRAIGETMVVLMLAGNAGIIPTDPLVSVRTLPGTIANEMGETVRGGLHFSALFFMGFFLFAVTFIVNLAADIVLERQRRRWRR
ncbi:MAG: phosphate ABC transporter permease subunit PstC [Actinobacteria bacterium]|nr:phosphate ABC transporter permease subunit PstC [Actinomycetota bacterium]